MDQGVLEALKGRYRRRLLHKLLLEDKDGQSMVEYAKLKHVVYMVVASAWDDTYVFLHQLLKNYGINSLGAKPKIKEEHHLHKLCLGKWIPPLRMILLHANRCCILC